MSETSETSITTPARRTSLIIIVAVICVLALIVLGYLGGYFILPGSIQSAYQDKNCGSVLSRYGLYTRVYPVFMQDKTLESHVMNAQSTHWLVQKKKMAPGELLFMPIKSIWMAIQMVFLRLRLKSTAQQR